jgi:hypothetical protein
MDTESYRSYRQIPLAEVTGDWEFPSRKLPPELIPVRTFGPDGKVGWTQPADTRAERLALQTVRHGAEYLFGVQLRPRVLLKRSERGKPVENFPQNIPLHNVLIPELPETAGGQKIGSFYANPKHDLDPTTLTHVSLPGPQEGMHYLGLGDLRDLIIKTGIFDTRLLAALLLAEKRTDLRFASRSPDTSAIVDEMESFSEKRAKAVEVLALRQKSGMAHVLAKFYGAKGGPRRVIVRVENGAKGGPGMTLPERAGDGAIGLVPNFNPLSGNGKGLWSPEIPGGLDGRTAELLTEGGGHIEGEAELLPQGISNPKHEAYGLDLAAGTVAFDSEPALEPTEVGMMRDPGWVTQDEFDEAVRRGEITDGRTMGVVFLRRLLKRRRA